MANELQLTYQGSATIYATLRRHDDSHVWSTSGAVFESWSDPSISDYAIALISVGGDLYQGDWPNNVDAGQYSVLYYTQTGESPHVNDLLVGTSDHYWNGQTIATQSSVTLDPYALTTLDAVKRHMRITSVADDTLITELVNRISDLTPSAFLYQPL